MSYGDRSIVVLNISWNTTQNQLVDEFSKYGKVLSINYKNGKETKKPGHSYIEFGCIKDVDNMIEISLGNNLILDNRVLNISQFKKNIQSEDDASVWQQKIESTINIINIVSDNLTWQQKEFLEDNTKIIEDTTKFIEDTTTQPIIEHTIMNEQNKLPDINEENLNNNIITNLEQAIQKEKERNNKFKYDNNKLKNENKLLKQIIDRNTENIRKCN